MPRPFASGDLRTYYLVMTKLLERALAAVRLLPPEAQDEIAQAMMHLAVGEREPEPVDPAHLAAILEGLGQAERREFASEAEVEAAFRRFDR
jgi:DNA-binding TFAR19-related protein (PDSD5 family)